MNNKNDYMPLLDVDHNLNIFITYVNNFAAYAAVIYDMDKTQDFCDGEKPIQTMFYSYMSPNAHGEAAAFLEYTKGHFFIGVDKDPSKALERATEQCNAYYRAKKEGVEVKLEHGKVEYVFPAIEDDPKRVSFDRNFNHPIEVKDGIHVTGLDEILKSSNAFRVRGDDNAAFDAMLPLARRLDGLDKATEERVDAAVEQLKGRGFESPTCRKLIEIMDANFNHPIKIEQPKFLKDAKVGSPIRTNEQRWAAYHKGKTTVGDALLMLDVLATAAAKEAGVLDDKVKIHPNLGSALQNIYFSNAILNYRELSVALLNWEAGNEINSKYRYLFKAILNNIKHGEDVRSVIDGFLRFVSSNAPADMHKFELVMRAVKTLQADNDIQETIRIMTAKFKGSFARAKPTALGGECKNGNVPFTGEPNEWDLLDSDVRAYYDNLAAEELDNDSDSETK